MVEGGIVQHERMMMGDSTALPHPLLPPPGRPKTFSRGQVCHRRAALSASILFLNYNVLQMISTRNALPSREIRRPSRALAFTREPHGEWVIHGKTLWEPRLLTSGAGIGEADTVKTYYRDELYRESFLQLQRV